MKKRVTIVLEVESEDEINMDDRFIRQDLEQEISCASNSYEVISFRTQKGTDRQETEIVRCEDCKNWIPGRIENNDTFIPPRCKRNAGVWTYDDYCSYGDREMKQDEA